ncbi:MAG: hypothetical protein AAB358_01615 [Patescibacteria group bacterium]
MKKAVVLSVFLMFLAASALGSLPNSTLAIKNDSIAKYLKKKEQKKESGVKNQLRFWDAINQILTVFDVPQSGWNIKIGDFDGDDLLDYRLEIPAKVTKEIFQNFPYEAENGEATRYGFPQPGWSLHLIDTNGDHKPEIGDFDMPTKVWHRLTELYLKERNPDYKTLEEEGFPEPDDE